MFFFKFEKCIYKLAQSGFTEICVHISISTCKYIVNDLLSAWNDHWAVIFQHLLHICGSSKLIWSSYNFWHCTFEFENATINFVYSSLHFCQCRFMFGKCNYWFEVLHKTFRSVAYFSNSHSFSPNFFKHISERYLAFLERCIFPIWL